MTFGGLFRTVATAGGSPPRPRVDPPSACGSIAIAVAALAAPRAAAALRRRPGFAARLHAIAGRASTRRPRPRRRCRRRHARGLRLPGRHRGLFAGYARGAGRPRTNRLARDRRARRSRCCASNRRLWRAAPGLPLRLRRPDPQPVRAVAALAAVAEVDRRAALRGGQRGLARARRALLDSLREIGIDSPEETRGRPRVTRTPPSSSTWSAASATTEAEAIAPDEGLILLRSAGERGEAEAIGSEVAKLIAARRRPGARSRSSSATRPGAGRCSPRCSSPTASRSRWTPMCRPRDDSGRRRPDRAAGG